jgi:hypothetical protein
VKERRGETTRAHAWKNETSKRAPGVMWQAKEKEGNKQKKEKKRMGKEMMCTQDDKSE